eukprot:TRINITY_DN8277_c0_g1_i1.p1 TRINITY_DN8277_c0_g1~~TRINITY_DN8277_c0_g1_i1.p1  ORF type:complete len:154 (-),score=18.56 TRINITY_DN8277_c0_g1_i1:97-558(-)
MAPWEQHDAGTGILEVKLKPISLPTIPMRRNHVVFTFKNPATNWRRERATVVCVLGGTLHPECDVPMDFREETREEQMPFIFASSTCQSWSRHYPLHGKDNTIAPNIYNGCTVGYNCLLYTSDAADEEDSVDLGGRRIIKKKKKIKINNDRDS